METLEERSIIESNIVEIVPVHSSLKGNKPCKSSNAPEIKMKVKDNKQLKETGCVNISDWLWGGTFGDKHTMLVFRSCVLASKVGNEETILSSNDNSEVEAILHKTIPYNRSSAISSIYECNQTETPKPLYNSLKKIDARNCLNNKKEIITMEVLKNNFNTNRKDSKLRNKSSSLPSVIGNLNDNDLYSMDSTVNVPFNNGSVFVPNKSKMPACILNITYKTAMTETKLLNKILQGHGFLQVDTQSNDFNLLWTGLHPKPDILRSLKFYQRVNHFPRSYELTRKDKLFKNIEKMQRCCGIKNFNFIPITFIIPLEYKELCTAHYRIKGPWIIKPAASSRGRGIYIVNSPDQIPKGESVVVAKYIDKPLLINGHKCDLRLYVCVTSFDPLLIYLYEEGLVRFATVKYDKNNKSLWNPCMHLCNYSINKYHSDYIKCNDPSVENHGHKWTLSAFLRRLHSEGYDTVNLMASIEDIVIKSILSCTYSISSASQMFVPHHENCFELFGFDILIDENLKPWLLEINLSPSLGCDSPLDTRLKAAILVDTLNLIGIPAVDPLNRSRHTNSGKYMNNRMNSKICRRVFSAENVTFKKRNFANDMSSNISNFSLLTSEEIKIVKYVKAQYQRRGGYVRIFPSEESWKKYSQFLDSVSGLPVFSIFDKRNTFPTPAAHNYNLLIHLHVSSQSDEESQFALNANILQERFKRYERILPIHIQINLDEDRDNETTFNKSTANDDSSAQSVAKINLKQQIQRGISLSLNESRRTFGMFLICVLRRISNSKTEQSVQHADLIFRFLKKVSHTLKMPYCIKSPSQKLNDTDKAAIVAKQLNDFLHIYHKETELYVDVTHKKGSFSSTDFSQFIETASEADLEDILLEIIKKESNVIPFLGDKQSPMCLDVPPSIPRISSKNVLLRHQLLRYLVYVTPLHSRRYELSKTDCKKYISSS